MGTLTADQERLPGYCDHKLPTSCRLTSIPNCCACADERAHAASYSTYIDGVGFVLRGNRWQRYCWFCKEFWEHRVKVSGLRPGQTRIPEVPDQTAFLERWYEFHRGYRIVRKEDGSEERIAVLGEEWREVSPGFLPRTLEELREGRRREEEHSQVQPRQSTEPEQFGQSLDDTLEDMFQAASLEESGEVTSAEGQRPEQTLPQARIDAERQRAADNVHAQAMVPAGSRNREYQARRVAALRRELFRMRNGIERVISGLRELGENVPDHTQATGNLEELGRTLDNITGAPSQQEAEQAIASVNQLANNAATSQTDRTLSSLQSRVDAARNQFNEARHARDQAASELDLAESEYQSSQSRLQQLQREQRTAENYMRIFGTREEMLAQGESYESPIGGMFRRADERFRVAEDVRREERTLRQVLEDEAGAGGEEEVGRLAELERRERDVWGVPQEPTRQPWTQDVVPVQTPRGPALVYRYPLNFPTRQSSEVDDAVEPPQGEETALGDYYRMMRQQEGSQLSPQSSTEQAVPERNSPRTMLNAVLEARQQEFSSLTQSEPPAEAAAPHRLSIAEREEWWRHDVEHIINALLNNIQLRETLQLNEQVLRAQLRYVQEDIIDERDRTTFDALLRDSTIVWQTGLPSEWLERRKAIVEQPREQDLLFAEPSAPQVERDAAAFATHHNAYIRTEIVAQAFQMSAQVRRQAIELSPPERLSMLYRLQAGHREEQDIAVLEHLQQNQESKALAVQTYNDNVVGQPPEWTDYARRYDDLRRQRARHGDHSRQELNANRQATSAFALAAGRQAMQTGPHTLLERMAERDAETRAAYQRLQANGFTEALPTSARTRPTLYRQLTLDDYGTSAPSASDSEPEDPEQGLDARDTGRPDPKTDEELMVQMECKICYTQTAEVACLPCGHLVMCRWCSDQHSPVMQHDRTRPRRAAGCPVCRKGIRQKVRVYRV